jgi:hypothetical protein
LKYKGIRPPPPPNAPKNKPKKKARIDGSSEKKSIPPSIIDGVERRVHESVTADELDEVFNQCVELLKVGTRQYAR